MLDYGILDKDGSNGGKEVQSSVCFGEIVNRICYGKDVSLCSVSSVSSTRSYARLPLYTSIAEEKKER